MRLFSILVNLCLIWWDFCPVDFFYIKTLISWVGASVDLCFTFAKNFSSEITMTHIPGLMSSNSMGSSWCCIETPFFTTLSLSLNSESDKMLESFNFHHFHLVEQLLPFSCEIEQKCVVYQDRNYARNKKVEYCLFCSSFLYLFMLEEKEKQR